MNLTKKSILLLASLTVGLASHASAQTTNGPSDPQIVGIVIVADKLDIAYGHIALARSHSKKVREFALRMVTDHGAVQKSVIKLAKKLHVKSMSSSTSMALEKGGASITARLHSIKSSEFDKYYIDNEVSYHKVVTDAVAKVLIPNAKNAELKAALEGAQPLFLAHLKHEEMVQAGKEGGMMHAHGMGK
jgi:putative membrane protein